MSLRDYSTEDLEAELRRRRRDAFNALVPDDPNDRYGCRCPPGKRREIVDNRHVGDKFYPRTGCLTCDRWDGPVRVRES